MAVTIGSRLGPYEIVARIGAGGMGEVYRARDTKLSRDVALKFLPEAFARDPERMARFEREAKVLASLSHANIAAIYGFEDSGKTRALVMELVEGPTLADRIHASAIPLDEALPIAKQICEAIEYAHERGIVHRDLKPANIKLADNDSVKILDFGLAKALEGDAASADISNSPTISRMATQAGIILGTAAYMSPEQAKGKSADRRTDIWAFGCVLYEMLTGKMAFSGETVTDTLAAVIRAEPDWSQLPSSTPPAIRNLLRRCLHKDPRQRLQAIGDARIAIDEAISNPAAVNDDGSSTRMGARTSSRRKREIVWGVAGLLFGVVAATVILLEFPRAKTQAARVSLSIALPSGQAFPTDVSTVAISPDGSAIAYVASSSGRWQAWVRRLGEFDAKPIPGPDDVSAPFFSPDGQSVAFFAGNKLQKEALNGGIPQVLCSGAAGDGTWAPDGTIYYTTNWYGSPLMAVSSAGGECRQEFAPSKAEGSVGFSQPQALPDSRAVLVTIKKGLAGQQSDIGVFSLKTHQLKTLVENATNPFYAAPGYLLFGRAGTLWGVPFDLRRLQLSGAAAPLVEGVANSGGGMFEQFAVSENGALLYVPGSSALEERQVVEVDRKGNARTVTPAPNAYEDLALSPDGEHLALTIEGSPWSIWTLDLQRQALRRLTFENDNRDVMWAADGKKVAYSSDRNGEGEIYEKLADGSGPEEELLRLPDWGFASSFSPDGREVAITLKDPKTNYDVLTMHLPPAGKPRPFLNSPANEWFAQFSPDSRWVAYESDESGRSEIYVQPFSGQGGRWQISNNGGQRPVWPLKDAEIFYAQGNKLVAVPVQTGSTFSAGSPHELFAGDYFASGHYFDATPDGQHFFFIKSLTGASGLAELRVVLNWTSGLDRHMNTVP
jgi:eukaryotic-like serine/threonine-protein kinase